MDVLVVSVKCGGQWSCHPLQTPFPLSFSFLLHSSALNVLPNQWKVTLGVGAGMTPYSVIEASQWDPQRPTTMDSLIIAWINNNLAAKKLILILAHLSSHLYNYCWLFIFITLVVFAFVWMGVFKIRLLPHVYSAFIHLTRPNIIFVHCLLHLFSSWHFTSADWQYH